MYPERYPETTFFGFASPIQSSLNKGLLLLQAHGFARVMEAAADFVIALRDTRPLVAKYDKEINYIDLKSNRLQESMITLRNVKLVFYAELIILIFASVAFAIEIFSTEIVFMLLTAKVINVRD